MRTRTRTTLAGLVLAAALVGGVAWATGTTFSAVAADGTIHACYRAANGDAAGQGQLRLVAAGDECRNNELAIQWSQQGPQGDRGLQGIQGLVGLQGGKGDTGSQGVAGATGSTGAPGAKGDPCLATDPACRGPKGGDGTDGTNGAAGPAGPQGPPGTGGGSLSSLDTLGGIACNAADNPGKIEVTYGPPPAGAVTLVCKPNPRFTLSLTVHETRTGLNTYATGRIRCDATFNTVCSQSYSAGSEVSLFALPFDGAVFTGWSGACSGTGSCVVTMNADTFVTASFGPRPA